MANSFFNSIAAFFHGLAEFLLAVVFALPGLLVRPAFIATFLGFTLVMWIGMSRDDGEPASSFSKAGVFAFIATLFLFVVIGA